MARNAVLGAWIWGWIVGCSEVVPFEPSSDPRPRVARVGGEVPLLDHGSWERVEAAADPFANHRPADVDCPPAAWGEEQGSLEVQTGRCDYLSLHQPLVEPIQRGDALHLVLWHGELRNPAPAEGHVAVLLGTERIWEASVPIPSKGKVFDVWFDADRGWAAGTPLTFHLHNHGFNRWNLLSFGCRRPPEANGPI